MEDEKKKINAWDPITATPDGGVVWRSYDGQTAVTHGDETPEQVAEPAADADAAIAALAGDVDNAPHAEVKFTVLSPDDNPIAPEEYGSRAAAEAALAAWCERFTQLKVRNNLNLNENNISNNIGNSNFGTINNALAARVLQLGARFSF